MKQLNRTVKRVFASVLSAIAGVSTAGCGGGGGTFDNQLVAYGPPPVLGITGKVTKSNGTPVKGIRIEEWGQNLEWYGATYTSADGTYRLNGRTPGQSIKIIVSDTDGLLNGGDFTTQIIELGVVDTWPKEVDVVVQPKSNSAQ